MKTFKMIYIVAIVTFLTACTTAHSQPEPTPTPQPTTIIIDHTQSTDEQSITGQYAEILNSDNPKQYIYDNLIPKITHKSMAGAENIDILDYDFNKNLLSVFLAVYYENNISVSSSSFDFDGYEYIYSGTAKWSPAETSYDGRYQLYLRGYSLFLIDTKTHTSKFIDEFKPDYTFEYGFTNGGNIFITNSEGAFIHSVDTSNHSLVFSTKDTFPCNEQTNRYLFDVYPNKKTGGYFAVYTDNIAEHGLIDGYIMLDDTFLIGILDENGVLTQTYDTGVNIMYHGKYEFLDILSADSQFLSFSVKDWYNNQIFKGFYSFKDNTFTYQ